MAKIYKILFIFTLLLTTFPLKAHVQHYDNLNRIEFDIYRNNKQIGKHIFSFIRDENRLKVESKINWEENAKIIPDTPQPNNSIKLEINKRSGIE